jgi:energy-converting hydrogenase Eha subunit B
MDNKVIVHKGRTNTLIVNMGINVVGNVFTSEIRSEPDQSAPLLAIWTVRFATDGSDGKLILTLDNLITGQITANGGYMDLKRMSGGEPIPVFDRPLEVTFRGTVTV